MRCSHDETLASPRKPRRLRKAARNVSCVASRASSSRPSMPKANAKMRRSQRCTISPNASASPERARSTICSSLVAVSSIWFVLATGREAASQMSCVPSTQRTQIFRRRPRATSRQKYRTKALSRSIVFQSRCSGAFDIRVSRLNRSISIVKALPTLLTTRLWAIRIKARAGPRVASTASPSFESIRPRVAESLFQTFSVFELPSRIRLLYVVLAVLLLVGLLPLALAGVLLSRRSADELRAVEGRYQAQLVQDKARQIELYGQRYRDVVTGVARAFEIAGSIRSLSDAGYDARL